MSYSHRVDIDGIRCDTLASDDVVRVIVGSAKRGGGGCVVTPNVDIVRQAATNAELATLVESAALVLVDGAPLEWACRIARHPEVHRTPGSSLVAPICEAAAVEGVKVLLLGGRPGSSKLAATKLARLFPGLQVSEHCPPYGFERDPVAYEEMVEAVRGCAGGIVFCGFGCPKQELLMLELGPEFPDTWFLGIGGSIDMLAGVIPRAPLWVQHAGIEWAFRLMVEPKRLAHRYLVDDVPVAAHLLAWSLSERARGTGAQGVGLATDRVHGRRSAGRFVLELRRHRRAAGSVQAGPGAPRPHVVQSPIDRASDSQGSRHAQKATTEPAELVIRMPDPRSSAESERSRIRQG